MKALILRNDAAASLSTAHALIDKGFQILSVDTQALAHALIRLDTIDLLVMDERIEGQLTHAIALSAERRNPHLSAILVTDRTAEQTDDLFELIPSLYGLVGHDTTARVLGKLALSAVSAPIHLPVFVEDAAVTEVPEVFETPQLEPLLLLHAQLTEVADDWDNEEPDYADVAIAAPALSEMVAAAESVVFQHTNDPVPAEVAALFRKTALPHFLQAPPPVAAQAS
ncbi:imidazoleglycerol-phosphate dehydratase [Yoonia sp. R78084]|uniref:imidazoleglycerol-phosphate dehydratase n=1 Tax=Yoonia sp. R78084 TaxID=3093869 RepID=UPI0037DC0C67